VVKRKMTLDTASDQEAGSLNGVPEDSNLGSLCGGDEDQTVYVAVGRVTRASLSTHGLNVSSSKKAKTAR
jgi:hypothetical protein